MARLQPASWPFILILYGHGVLCVAALGMLSPLTGDLARHFADAPASMLGIAISAIFVAGAILSVAGGWLVARIGAPLALRTGTLILIAADLGCWTGGALSRLIAFRLLGGLGLLLLLNAAPIWLMASTQGRQQGQAMAVWSTFVSGGWILGPVIAILFVGRENWQDIFLLHALLLGLLGLAALALPSVSPNRATAPATPVAEKPAGVFKKLCMAASFAGMTIAGIGINVILPVSLQARFAWSPMQSAGFLAVLTLCCLAGGLALGQILRRDVRFHRLAGAIGATGLLGLIGAFLLPSSQAPMPLLSLILWSLAQGASVALVMAQMPVLARSPAQRRFLAGLINQMASISAVVTAPLFLGIYQWRVDAGAGALALACWTVATTLLWPLGHGRREAEETLAQP